MIVFIQDGKICCYFWYGSIWYEDKKEEKKNKKSDEAVFHQVEAKETKYSIAKQYGISVEDLERSNPDIKDGLQIGFRLKIPANASKSVTKLEEKAVETEKKTESEPIKTDNVGYVVLPKETLFGLSRKLGISQENLIKLNPES